MPNERDTGLSNANSNSVIFSAKSSRSALNSSKYLSLRQATSAEIACPNSVPKLIIPAWDRNLSCPVIVVCGFPRICCSFQRLGGFLSNTAPKRSEKGQLPYFFEKTGAS